MVVEVSGWEEEAGAASPFVLRGRRQRLWAGDLTCASAGLATLRKRSRREPCPSFI